MPGEHAVGMPMTPIAAWSDRASASSGRILAIQFDWHTFIQRLFEPGRPFWGALVATVVIAVLAMLMGVWEDDDIDAVLAAAERAGAP